MTHAILLTGASGMLGRRAALALCERGHRVIGVDVVAAALAHPNYAHATCDLTDPAAVEARHQFLVGVSRQAGRNRTGEDKRVFRRDPVELREQFGEENVVVK